jgi:hypothetical protein
MGATYLSMQLRTTDRDAAVAALEAISAAQAAYGLQFYVTESVGGWLAIFPNFTPELEHTAKALSARLACLIVLLLSADEDDLYCMFFRDGKQLPWFKVGAPRKRRGKEREKLAAKLEALAEVCDERSRERLVEILADSTAVIFSSDLLRAVCEIVGIRNAFSSFEYMKRGEREGLEVSREPTLVPGSHGGDSKPGRSCFS